MGSLSPCTILSSIFDLMSTYPGSSDEVKTGESSRGTCDVAPS